MIRMKGRLESFKGTPFPLIGKGNTLLKLAGHCKKVQNITISVRHAFKVSSYCWRWHLQGGQLKSNIVRHHSSIERRHSTHRHRQRIYLLCIYGALDLVRKRAIFSTFLFPIPSKRHLPVPLAGVSCHRKWPNSRFRLPGKNRPTLPYLASHPYAHWRRSRPELAHILSAQSPSLGHTHLIGSGLSH